MVRLKLIILINLFCLLWFGIAQSEPPHPSKHYSWKVWPNGNVVLHYRIDGYETKYVYRLVHEVEPATPCAPKYGATEFRLVTWDTTYPYYYTMHIDPVMVWDTGKQEFVEME